MARLSNCRSYHRCGCPVLRVGEKGGYDDGIHNGRCRTDKSCAGSIAAHPCKKRKDGAPCVGMVQRKDGPPADYALIDYAQDLADISKSVEWCTQEPLKVGQYDA